MGINWKEEGKRINYLSFDGETLLKTLERELNGIFVDEDGITYGDINYFHKVSMIGKWDETRNKWLLFMKNKEYTMSSAEDSDLEIIPNPINLMEDNQITTEDEDTDDNDMDLENDSDSKQNEKNDNKINKKRGRVHKKLKDVNPRKKQKVQNGAISTMNDDESNKENEKKKGKWKKIWDKIEKSEYEITRKYTSKTMSGTIWKQWEVDLVRDGMTENMNQRKWKQLACRLAVECRKRGNKKPWRSVIALRSKATEIKSKIKKSSTKYGDMARNRNKKVNVSNSKINKSGLSVTTRSRRTKTKK